MELDRAQAASLKVTRTPTPFVRVGHHIYVPNSPEPSRFTHEAIVKEDELPARIAAHTESVNDDVDMGTVKVGTEDVIVYGQGPDTIPSQTARGTTRAILRTLYPGTTIK